MNKTITAIEPSTCVDSEPFALQVTDDSMEPEFQKGCLVVVDPSGVARDGAYVIAELDEGLGFGRLRLEAHGAWLDSLNRDYPSRQIEAGVGAVRGVVVQRAGKRRAYHKHYD